MNDNRNGAPDRKQIVAEICRLLAPFNKNSIEIDEATSLNADLEVDSVAAVDLVMEIEDRFDISIPINLLMEVQTVGELATIAGDAVGERG